MESDERAIQAIPLAPFLTLILYYFSAVVASQINTVGDGPTHPDATIFLSYEMVMAVTSFPWQFISL